MSAPEDTKEAVTSKMTENSAKPPAVASSAATTATSKTPAVPATTKDVPQPSKKRKLAYKAITHLLADYPVIQQAVRDMSSLLQLYGPLTAAQLEYNLPPLRDKHLHDILQVLVTIGLVKEVKEASGPRYAMTTVPRTHAVEPIGLADDILQAQAELQASSQRAKILEEALVSKVPARNVLKEVLQKYPDIRKDPVYATALKNCHVDASPDAAKPTAAKVATTKTSPKVATKVPTHKATTSTTSASNVPATQTPTPPAKPEPSK